MIYKILSFDVGVKNLAYCLLEIDTITKEYKINNWNIINLSDEVIIPKCNFKVINVKAGTEKLCGKTASFTYGLEGGCLCKVHKKKVEKNAPIANHQIKEIKKKKAKKKPLIDLNKAMIQKLDEIPGILDIQEVVIENQPSLKNPHMKSIQMMIFSYFIMRGIADIKDDEDKIKDVVMLSARNKLKIYKGPEIECDITDKYRRNKYLAIQYCAKMIEGQEQQFLDQYSASKKKDDLADSFLQGVFYLDKKFKL